MDDWWSSVDADIMDALAGGRLMTPEELGQKLGLSAAATTSLISLLACEGKVRIVLVGRSDSTPGGAGARNHA